MSNLHEIHPEDRYLFEQFNLLPKVTEVISLVRTGGTQEDLEKNVDGIVLQIRECHRFLENFPDLDEDDLDRNIAELESILAKQELNKFKNKQ